MNNFLTINNYRNIRTFSLLLGFSSTISQIILLRELITTFYGNEIAYAVILSSWLFWISIGSLITSYLVKKVKDLNNYILVLQFLIFIILIATVIASRTIKVFLGVPTGQIIGITQMCILIFALTFPLTFFFGSIFTLLCSSLEFNEKVFSSHKITMVYLWEAIGAALGGFIFSFVLIHLFSSIQIAYLLGLINFAFLLYTKSSREEKNPLKYIFFFILFILLLPLLNKLDHFSRIIEWKGFNIVTIKDSIYGNIALTKYEEDYNLYENGVLSFSTKDDYTAEESVHYALLQHPNPKKILLIGNGIGGAIKEILKFPDIKIDYVELDPDIIEISKKYLPQEHILQLNDKNVEIFNTDARLFVKAANRKYDVVIVNLSDPHTALINRYYSLDFFKNIKNLLNNKGIISFDVSSSENYVNDETKDFLRSINSTLKKIFPSVISIPGDSNIFIASIEKGSLTQDPSYISLKLKESGIETRYVREYYLPYKLSPSRINYINEILDGKGEINKDTRPIAYLFDNIRFSGQFDTVFKNIFLYIRSIKLWHLIIFSLLVYALSLIISKKFLNFPVTISIVTTGFSEIIFQILIIMSFQSLYGYAYYKIGLIVASFMLGIVLGAINARKIIVNNPGKIKTIYKFVQFLISLYPLLIPIIFITFIEVDFTQKFLGLFAGVFAFLPIVAGYFGGLQYPLAVELQIKENSKFNTAGFLYAFDMLGAAIGAIITAAFLIPLLGIVKVSFFCFVLNFLVFLLLITTKNKI